MDINKLGTPPDDCSISKIDYRHDYVNEIGYMCFNVYVDNKYESSLITSDYEAYSLDEFRYLGFTVLEPVNRNNQWFGDSIKRFLFNHEFPNTSEMFDALYSHSTTFVGLSEEDRTLLVLWIMGSYLHPLFDAYPLLFLNGQASSGKTSTMNYISSTTYNSFKTSKPTTYVTKHLLNESPGVLLLDEMENLNSLNGRYDSELVRILNSSFSKGESTSYCVQDSDKRWKPESANLYRPVCIGNVNGIDEDTLITRVIMINMTLDPSYTNATKAKDDNCREIREMLYAWALGNWKQVRDKYHIRNTLLNSDNYCIYGRYADVFAPLISIATDVSQHTVDTVIKVASDKQSQDKKDMIWSNPDVPKLDSLLSLLGDKHEAWIKNVDIAEYLSKELRVHTTTQASAKLIHKYKLSVEEKKPGNKVTFRLSKQRIEETLSKLGC